MPPGAVADTVTAHFNDLEAVERSSPHTRARSRPSIVEPVAGNMGLVPPEGFLEGLRAITARDGALLVFDEVMTGFRVAGGAQALYGIKPDMTTLGKVIGGGLPVGATGAGARSWSSSRPPGPCTRPARSPGTRWR